MNSNSESNNSGSISKRTTNTSFSDNQILPLVVNLDGTDTEDIFDVLCPRVRVIALGIKDIANIPQEIYDEAYAVMLHHYIKLDQATLAKFRRLRLIVRFGVGFDNVDIPAATKLGIAVCTTPAFGVEEVADTAMSGVLNLFRRTHQAAVRMHTKEDLIEIPQIRESAFGARRIRGKTLGIGGLGRIGIAVSIRAKAFGFNVAFYDPYAMPGIYKSLGLQEFASMKEFLSNSDCLVLTMSMDGDKNKHCINADSIQTMKQGVCIVNVSRGGLIDDAALADALRSGRVAGAYLDVHLGEPYNPLKDGGVYADVPNLMMTPHSAWYSAESNREIFRLVDSLVVRATNE